ncbi:MAG TPA: XTP/dITP diphosphatase [Candidatus Methanofastidiosa archaeon]|nr:XTP/dITP diphosphatase [Candidatus Methanofastidiosa archaeon]HPR41010.1 XTP/dITP diphosphatase [Candidatus Methanofastidiosa archaeon]
MKMVFVTGNGHKFKEASLLFRDIGIEIAQKDLGYPEIQADTLEEVAESGIVWCMERLKKPCFIEDAGIFIDALMGFPGPYSRYVSETIGNRGILKLMEGEMDRGAVFRSVIAYNDGNDVHLFVGETRGSICHEARGQGGFGYDPVFIPANFDRTFAQMGTEEKNKHSHRGKSLNKLVNYFKERK